MEKCCLTVTYKCNWNCPYCIVNTHERKEIVFSDVIKKVNSVEDNSIIAISGGEPGLLSTNELSNIIEKLKSKNCIIEIATNGEFFKRHPLLLHLIDKFIYHASDNLNITDEIYLNPNLKISYVIVVHDKNIQNLSSFLNKNKNISFYVFGASKSSKFGSPTLSIRNKIKIIKDHKNAIKDHPINLFQRSNITVL